MYRLRRIDGSVIAEGESYRAILADLLGFHANSSLVYRWPKFLQYANLAGLNLVGVDLTGADLSYANLAGANLAAANLAATCLNYADLSYADLCQTSFRNAVLIGTNFQSAVVSVDTSFMGASLERACNIPPKLAAYTSILPEGDIIGWKKCSKTDSILDGNNVLVKLKIPANARRTNATGRRCRAEFAEVLDAGPAGIAYSFWDPNFVYRTGETAYCDVWQTNRWIECGGGIHFFITSEEAGVVEF